MIFLVIGIAVFWLTPLAIFLIDSFSWMVFGSFTGLYAFPEQEFITRTAIIIAWTIFVGLIAGPLIGAIVDDMTNSEERHLDRYDW